MWKSFSCQFSFSCDPVLLALISLLVSAHLCANSRVSQSSLRKSVRLSVRGGVSCVWPIGTFPNRPAAERLPLFTRRHRPRGHWEYVTLLSSACKVAFFLDKTFITEVVRHHWHLIVDIYSAKFTYTNSQTKCAVLSSCDHSGVVRSCRWEAAANCKCVLGFIFNSNMQAFFTLVLSEKRSLH